MALGLQKRLGKQPVSKAGEEVDYRRQVEAGTAPKAGASKSPELTKDERRRLVEQHLSDYLNKSGQKG